MTPFYENYFSNEQIKRTFLLIQKGQVMPLEVSQQVLALHPARKELRTAQILTNHGDNYHVQYHNPDLGVTFQKDKTIVPISSADPLNEDEQLSGKDQMMQQMNMNQRSGSKYDEDRMDSQPDQITVNLLRDELFQS